MRVASSMSHSISRLAIQCSASLLLVAGASCGGNDSVVGRPGAYTASSSAAFTLETTALQYINRARLRPSAGRALDRLIQEGEVAHARANNRGTSGFVAGRDLRNATCRTRPEQPAGAATAPEFEAVLCVLQANAGLFVAEDEALDLSTVRHVQTQPGTSAGERMVEIRQYAHGLKVREGHLKAFLIGDRIVELNGELFDVSDVPIIPPGARERAVSVAAGIRGRSVVLSDEFYSMTLQRPVCVARDAEASSTGIHEYEIDMLSLEIISIKTAGHANPGNYQQSFWTRDHTASSGFAPAGSLYQTSSRSALGYCGEVAGGGTCGNSGSGRCRFFPRRATGTLDHVHSTLYKYDAWPDTPEWNGLTVYAEGDCGSSTAWLQRDYDDYWFFAANAFYYISQAAELKNHWASYFYYGHTKHAITLNVQDFPTSVDELGNPTSVGIYTPFDKRISLWRSQPPDTGSEQRAAEDLNASIHEYGHYVYDTYGNHGTDDLHEGWADHYPLRYAVYQVVNAGVWPSTTYASELNAWRPYRHTQKTLNGEYLVNGSSTWDSQLYYYPAAECSTGEPYLCGAVISITYWELAWDQCQLNFNGCPLGADIIQSGLGYNTRAYELANSAYAYAIYMSVAGSSAESFHDSVQSRYYQFYSQSSPYIDWGDYARVGTVLQHHCLGWWEACSTGGHRLPGSPLPSAQTGKVPGYVEAENATLVGAGVTRVSDCLASNCSYVRFAGGQPPTTFAYWSVPFTQTGTHKLHVVASPLVPGSVVFEYRYDMGAWIQKTVTPLVGWTWLELGTFSVGSTGSHWIDIRVAGSNAIIVDAIRAEP